MGIGMLFQWGSLQASIGNALKRADISMVMGYPYYQSTPFTQSTFFLASGKHLLIKISL
jgi:hypothetical protein